MFRAGQQIGVYTLINRIGRGGFGEVWLAERRAKFVTTKVAVKLPLDEQVDHEAIKQEATLWEQASGHLNILPIIDADEYDGQIVIVSEYAPDGSLEQWLKQNGRMSVEKAVEMTIQILDGLEFLHSRNIIHRDLKPANILLQGNRPRLTDFGISRALRTTMTSQSQHISGTFAYMSPEALDGKRSVQTDIWSVGVNLYQFLTGTLPFPQKEPSVLFPAIILRDYEPLPDFVPPQIKAIVATALAKLPENRYKTAGQMRDALLGVLRGNVRPTPIDTPPLIPPDAPSQTPPSKPSHKIVVPVAANPSPVATNVKAPVDTNDTATVVRPVSSHAFVKGKGKSKMSWLYLAVPVMALLLFAIIGGGYWLWLSNRTLVPFRQGDKFGFSDTNKQLVIEAIYDDAQPFRHGLARVKLNGKYGFINRWGEPVGPIVYDYVEEPPNELFLFKGPTEEQDPPDETLYAVKRDDKFGYVDSTGKEVIPLKYDSVSHFNEGFASVQLNKHSGVIDRNGKEITPLIYDSISPFNQGLAAVVLNKKYGFVDKTGKEVISLKYDGAEGGESDRDIWLFFGQHTLDNPPLNVKLNDKWGYIDRTGKEITSFKYNSASMFSEGLAVVELNKKWGFIDRTGKEVIPLQYDEVFLFLGEVAAVKLNDKWGYIDKTGKVVVPLQYEKVGIFGFREGLASVKLNDKWGFIDSAGNMIISPKFDGSEKFDFGSVFIDGLAMAIVNKKHGFIDKAGREVIPFKYANTGLFVEGFAQVTRDGKVFYIDKKGTEYYTP